MNDSIIQIDPRLVGQTTMASLRRHLRKECLRLQRKAKNTSTTALGQILRHQLLREEWELTRQINKLNKALAAYGSNQVQQMREAELAAVEEADR